MVDNTGMFAVYPGVPLPIRKQRLLPVVDTRLVGVRASRTG